MMLLFFVSFCVRNCCGRFCSLSRDKFHRFWCEKWELSAAGKLLRGGVSCGHGLLTKLKFCSGKEKQFLVNDY